MKKIFTLIGIIAIIALALAACKNEPDPTHTHVWGSWQETTAPTATEDGEETRTCTLDSSHKERRLVATITAFGKDITVKGNASISKTDFDTAKENLQEAMKFLAENFPGDSPFTSMLERNGFAILIETGNASPDANVEKSMTIGVDYLIKTAVFIDATTPSITLAIVVKVLDDKAFAD